MFFSGPAALGRVLVQRATLPDDGVSRGVTLGQGLRNYGLRMLNCSNEFKLA